MAAKSGDRRPCGSLRGRHIAFQALHHAMKGDEGGAGVAGEELRKLGANQDAAAHSRPPQA